MEHKRSRGRPPTYLQEDRKYLAELVRQYGIAGAKRRTGMPVSFPTMAKIAHEFNIRLSKGRRPTSVA